LPFRERRYRLALSPEQWAEAERLAGAQDFLRLNDRLRPRYGKNEQTLIEVCPRSGPGVAVATWAPADHPDFLALYSYVQGLCAEPDDRHLVYEGPFDWDWRPEGFDRPR
jgi:hypothetical protein